MTFEELGVREDILTAMLLHLLKQVQVKQLHSACLFYSASTLL